MAQTPNQFDSPRLIAQNPLTSLSEGSQGLAVTELQRQLGRNGLFPATSVNGVYGPATVQAVRQFQRIRRLNVTGIADLQTLNLLGVNLNQFPVGLSHSIHGTISSDRITPKSSRTDIRTLQRVLRSFGFNLDADGVYGDQTRQAVRAYERTAGLPVDGIADQATLLDMGFSSGGRSNQTVRGNPATIANPAVVGGRQSLQGRYIAAVIAGRADLARVRLDFPNAFVDSNRIGDYISLGRFTERSDAAAWVDLAQELGYEARILRRD